jgi:hypothetical protein
MGSLRKGDSLSIAPLLCLLLLFAAGNLFGQAATASISGRVTDPPGAGVPEAPVVIKNTGTSATQTVSTDNQGRYTVSDLAIGTYELTATKLGFQTSVRSGVTLTVGSAPVIDFSLQVGQATQSVEVSADVSQVETANASLSSLVNQTQIRELPLNGRDFEQLILLAPGVLSLSVGRQQRADFGRQRLFDLRHKAGRLREFARRRRYAELVAAQRGRQRNRYFARH